MKDKRIEIRVTQELYNTLQVKSKAAGMSISKYVRNAILESDIKVDNSKDIATLIGSINKIGNNLNQIAHNLNIANNSNKLDDIKYDQLLDELLVIKYYLNELSNEFI